VLVPVLAILARATQGELPPGVGELIATTLALALGSGLVAGLIGLAGAWLSVRVETPARGLLLALLVSPLAAPPYLVALTWLDLGGTALHGRLVVACLLLGVCTSPLVLLVTRAAVARLDPHMEEAAALLGLGARARFFRVLLPALRPALAAGLCLVVLYAFADFGAVSALGAKTFTRAIYFELDLGQDRALAWSRAASLALVLLALAIPVFALEQRARSGRFEQGGRRRAPRANLAGAIAVWALALSVFGSTAGLVVVRALWHARDLPWQHRAWGNALEALSNSVVWAASAATLAVLFALVLAWCAARLRDPFHDWMQRGATLGFVLPGPVVALGLLLALSASGRVGYHLEGTVVVLVAAYLVRYLPEALQAASAGLAQAPARLEEAGRMLGLSAPASVFRVTVPMLRGSIAAGWVLVFAASLRELPATLLLSPLGARALSSEIWRFAKDSHYEQMAPSALLLVALTLPAVVFILRKGHAEAA